jgi:P27 family predicted phage terminase small subunit
MSDRRAKYPEPPPHLEPATAAWWRAVVRDYDLPDHDLMLLQAAAESWDRMQQAREEIARDGLTVKTAQGGLKPHPAVGIERDAKVTFARLIRELALDSEPAPEIRLPRPRGTRR